MNARFLVFLSFVVGCGGASTPRAVGSDEGACYPNGTCDPGLDCVAATCVPATIADAGADDDSGSNVDGGGVPDAGVTSDSGVPVGGACLLTDTDTDTYSYVWYSVHSAVAHFNVDGVGDENTTAGCGIADGVNGIDNGYGDMVAAQLSGGTPHGQTVTSLDADMSNGLEPSTSAGSDLRVTVVFTHVRADIIANPNDPCVGVRVDVARTGTNYPSASGVGSFTNSRFQGALDSTLSLHFPGTRLLAGQVLDFDIRNPVLDITISTSFNSFVDTASFIGGFVFFRPSASDIMAGRSYTGYSLDAALAAVGGSAYDGIRPWLTMYQDLFMLPDGTLAPCGVGITPNSFAVNLRLSANHN